MVKLRTNRRDRRVWRWVRVVMVAVIAVEVLALTYLNAHNREAQRLSENYESGMKRFADVWNAQP